MVVLSLWMSIGCVKLAPVDRTLTTMENPSSVQVDISNTEQAVAIEQKQTPSYDDLLNRFRVGGQIPFPASSDVYTIDKTINVRLTEEGSVEEPIYIVRQHGTELFRVFPVCTYDWDTETHRCTHQIQELMFHTEGVLFLDGISVGSTLGEFVEVFPEYRLWHTYISDMYVVETSSLKAKFILEKDGFIGTVEHQSDITKLNMSDFQEDTKIVKIRIVQE